MNESLTAKKKPGRPVTRPSADWLLHEYKQHTATEIANAYNVKPSTVRSWVARARKEWEVHAK